MKKCLVIISLLFITLQAQAFEDYIITTKGKLTDISIENNTIINVYPLITLFNNKNTLIVEPLKEGHTRFCVLKNNKDKIMFDVEITQDKTTIKDVKDFKIQAIDIPMAIREFILDEPPTKLGGQ